jgi:hypothetical protein
VWLKVLDFGLAKAAEESPSTADLVSTSTVTMSLTRAGTILGAALI